MRPPRLDELPQVAHLRSPGGILRIPDRHFVPGRPSVGQTESGRGRIRTPMSLLRRQALCPVEPRAPIARARNRTWTLPVRSRPLCPLSHAGMIRSGPVPYRPRRESNPLRGRDRTACCRCTSEAFRWEPWDSNPYRRFWRPVACLLARLPLMTEAGVAPASSPSAGERITNFAAPPGASDPGKGRSLGRRRPPQRAAELLLCHPVAWEERRGSNPLLQGHGLSCCRYTTFLIVETARFSGEASGENRTPILPLTGRPLGQFKRRWQRRGRKSRLTGMRTGKAGAVR